MTNHDNKRRIQKNSVVRSMIKDLNQWFDYQSVKVLEDEFSAIRQRLHLLEAKLQNHSNPVVVSGYTAPPDESYMKLENDSFSHRMKKRNLT